MRNVGAVGTSARLHGQRAHVPIPGIVTVRMPQADENSQVATMILRVVPARIDNLVGIRRGQDLTVADSVINPIMTVIERIRAQLVTPIAAITVIAQPIRRLYAARRGAGTGFVQRLALVGDNLVIGHAVGGITVVENRLFGGTPVERRVQERCNQFCRARGNTAREMDASKHDCPGQGNHQQGKFGKQAQAWVH